MAESTAVLACRMSTWKRTLCGDACFVFVESTESDTIPFLFQGEPKVNRVPTAEPRDCSYIADPSLVSEGSASRGQTKIPSRRLECLIRLVWLYTVCWGLFCLRGWCRTRDELSVPWWADILTCRVSGVHVRIVHQLLPVLFRSGFYSFPLCSDLRSVVLIRTLPCALNRLIPPVTARMLRGIYCYGLAGSSAKLDSLESN